MQSPERRLNGEILSTEELLGIPPFQGSGVSPAWMEKNRQAVVRRRFRKGELVCRQGDYDYTAFYVLEGKVDVFLETLMGHVKSEGGARGLLSRVRSRLVGRDHHRREEEEADRRWIPIDAPIDLAYDNPLAQLGPGDLFGEMSCLNFYPRSATVQAAEDCTLLEMLYNVLRMLQRSKTFKTKLEETYRSRTLAHHLRSVPLFKKLTNAFVDRLCEKAEFRSFDPDDQNQGVIVRQGNVADSFFLVRVGFVKVSQNQPGGELALKYLGRGDYFGEMGLLGEGRRTATCTALDHVELVLISAEDFNLMLQTFPEVRNELESVAKERREENARRVEALQSVAVHEFLGQHLMEAQSLLILDLNRCTRCDACVRACADSHDGITRLIREGLRFDHYLVATSCRQCRDPLCIPGCPVGAIHRRNTLEVIIEDWCIGCGKCAESCPYGNINMHPFTTFEHAPNDLGARKAVVKEKATTCDLCPDHAEPSCVYACPHDAAHRVNPNKFFGKLFAIQGRR